MARIDIDRCPCVGCVNDANGCIFETDFIEEVNLDLYPEDAVVTVSTSGCPRYELVKTVTHLDEW